MAKYNETSATMAVSRFHSAAKELQALKDDAEYFAACYSAECIGGDLIDSYHDCEVCGDILDSAVSVEIGIALALSSNAIKLTCNSRPPSTPELLSL